jgi:hypothetical protein
LSKDFFGASKRNPDHDTGAPPRDVNLTPW